MTRACAIVHWSNVDALHVAEGKDNSYYLDAREGGCSLRCHLQHSFNASSNVSERRVIILLKSIINNCFQKYMNNANVEL